MYKVIKKVIDLGGDGKFTVCRHIQMGGVECLDALREDEVKPLRLVCGACSTVYDVGVLSRVDVVEVTKVVEPEPEPVPNVNPDMRTKRGPGRPPRVRDEDGQGET